MKRLCLILACSSIWLLADPGGVIDVQLWLRADAGVTGTTSVSQWDDQSGNGWNATQSTSARQPTLNTNRANFNPVLSFDQDFLDVSHHNELNGPDLTVFVVTRYVDRGRRYSSPWTTRDDTSIGSSHDTRGHILYVHNAAYEYWNGQGTGGWHVSATGASVSDQYEITTARSKSNNSGTKIRKKFFYQGENTYNGSNVDFSKNIWKPFRVGAGRTESTGGDYFWDGDIAELIVYDQPVAADDRKQIESYLALKYGITLTQNKRYYDSAGTEIWRPVGQYKHDIAGLARDYDESRLDQRVAKSINSDAIITMSTNTDFTSANPGSRPQFSPNNHRFVIWANNDGDNHWTATGAPAGGKILGRTWRVSKRHTPHTVNIQIDVDDADFDLDPFIGDLYFVRGTDLSSATPVKMTNDGGGKWHIEDIDFDDGEKFGFVIGPQTIPDANILINEVLYNEPNSGTHEGEEFIEFYVESGGEIKDLVLSDQDKQVEYRFPTSCSVQTGDYVVFHRIDDTHSDSCNPGGVSHFYMENVASNKRLGNQRDDIVLLRPSNTDVTTLADGHSFLAVPIDYISWGNKNSSGNNYDDAPTSTYGHIQPSWDTARNTNIKGASDGQSISLTPNALDSDDSACWEWTATTSASHQATCAGALPTRDTETDTSLTYSMGVNNNAAPEMHITKTSIVLNDPVNAGSNPKRIPGATIRYCFTVDNDGTGDADDATISDSLTGDGKDNLTYVGAGGKVQADSSACDCNSAMTDATVSHNNDDVNITLGTITPSQRGCAYIETTIN